MARKTYEGKVVSKKMAKTAVVEVQSVKIHPKYGKRSFAYKKFKAHDENDMVKENDRVLIEETKPLSKTKMWIVKSIITK